ncbi:MAG: prolyl oligopeptidase family serine peptidase [Armatimonadetes bacterium]|nr:prolyl oligopeptidase family serine peptidase [Armatimonadota bacterium]
MQTRCGRTDRPLMRYLSPIVCAAAAVLLLPQLVPATPDFVSGYAINYYVSDIDGSYQPYGIYLPQPYDPERPHPVVLHLHGFGGRMGGFGSWQREWADSRGWILAYPDGRGSNNYDGIGEDDVFQVLDDLKARYRVDEERIYLTGGSMGGHGSYRLPLRHPHVFAAGAPIAGWTDFREFYAHFYEQADAPRMPEYIDPSRRPLLETASSLWQTENAKYTHLLIGYGIWDYVNPPSNAEQVVQRLREFGYTRFDARGDWGGHGAGYDTEEVYTYFEGKTREREPAEPVYVTNTLKHNRAYWIRIDRLRVNGQWARLAARAEGNTVWMEAANVAGYTLLPENSPVRFDQPVTVYTNGLLGYRGTPGGALSIAARFDERFRVVAWGPSPPESGVAARKRHGFQGPLNDAFLSRFVVTYGTAGSARETRRNREDALRFCAEWNNWMVMHWGWDRPPRRRRRPWFEIPYPFAVGPYIPEEQPPLQPIRDTEVTAEEIAAANLVLFGDPRSHHLIRRIRALLPIVLTNDGAVLGDRAYTGPTIRYTFIVPNPMNPRRYAVISRGYLSSRIDPVEHSPSRVGKDLEALPFYWPDYVIWDSARRPAETVQSPFVYLPETYLEAGYFDESWQLDDDPPGTTAFLRGDGEEATDPGAVTIALVAEDRPGGFGVDRTEYRLDGGPWARYAEPLRVECPGEHRLEFRSVDRCGRFIYRMRDGRNRGEDAEGNPEPVRNLTFRVQEAR